MSKRRFTRNQALDALLAAGREILDEVGPAGGVGHVTLSEAINRSGVPRPSAYRVFGDADEDPLRAFQEELMIDLTESDPAFSAVQPQVLRDLVVEILDEVESLGIETTSEQLTALLADLFHRVSTTLLHPQLVGTSLAVHLSLLAATVSGPPNPRLEEALREARLRTTESLAPFLREVLASFGLKLRAGWTITDLSNACINAVLGSLLTEQVTPSNVRIVIAGGERNGDQTWSPLGVTLLAITAMASERDPRMVVSAQPSLWAGAPAH